MRDQAERSVTKDEVKVESSPGPQRASRLDQRPARTQVDHVNDTPRSQRRLRHIV